MDSQARVSSSASTVPLDLIHDQDNAFVDEISTENSHNEEIQKKNGFFGNQLYYITQ
jgi:hypothetical protein